MTLDPSINLSVDVLDEGPDEAETLVINWLRPLLPDGSVANDRLPEDPLPFILVVYVDGTENVDESYSDDVVSVHCLYRKGLGASERKAAKDFANLVHRRMLLLARYLEPIPIGDRVGDVDSVTIFSRPRWEPYGDEQIVRKVGRYRIGASYAKLS